MKTTLSLVFMVYYFNFLVCGHNNEYKALIFNRKRNPSLISIPNESSLLQKCDTWVSACPAATEDEKKFEEKYSLYNAALFVKNIYTDKDDCTDIQKDTCEEPYKLSMAWFKEAIEFGYEIYFEHDESANSKFNINDAAFYDDYEPLKAFLEVESLSFMDMLKSIHNLRKSTGETGLMLKDKKMEFIWIPLFKLWFNANRLRTIEYEIRKENINPLLKCEDYSLGKELIHNTDVDELYSKEHQEERLYGLIVPPASAINGCEEGYKCLTKWLLLPSDQFQFETGPFSTRKCSNIATVPIWKSTLEGILIKLNVYLYTLSRVSGKPLRIVAGVSGILSLPPSRYFALSGYVTLFDDKTKFSIRVPNIIYKIIKIKTNKCELHTTCWYGVLIVIHNDPYFDEKNTICEDITKDWGWWQIKLESYDMSSEENPSKFIYVCKISRQSIEALGLMYEHDMIIGELSLKRFPVYEGEELTYLEMDIKVNNEFERMNKPGESIEIEDVIIERPPIYKDDFNEYLLGLYDSDDVASQESGDGETETSVDASSKKHQ